MRLSIFITVRHCPSFSFQNVYRVLFFPYWNYVVDCSEFAKKILIFAIAYITFTLVSFLCWSTNFVVSYLVKTDNLSWLFYRYFHMLIPLWVFLPCFNFFLCHLQLIVRFLCTIYLLGFRWVRSFRS